MEISGCPRSGRFDLQMKLTEKFVKRVDLSLDRCARGHGCTSSIVCLGLQAMEKYWGSKTEAVAEVLKQLCTAAALQELALNLKR